MVESQRREKAFRVGLWIATVGTGLLAISNFARIIVFAFRGEPGNVVLAVIFAALNSALCFWFLNRLRR